MRELLYSLGSIASLALGLFQLVTIALGLHEYLGWHYVFTTLIAFCFAVWPVVGTVIAIWAAQYAWHWPLIQSVIIFAVALGIMWVLTDLGGGVGRFTRRRKSYE